MPESDRSGSTGPQSSARISLEAESARWDRAFESDRLRGEAPHPAVVEFFEDHLVGVDGRLLDLGCGFGRHMVFFASHGYHSVGVDFSSKALAGAASRLKQADVQQPRLVRAEFGKLSLLQNSFSGAVSIQAIYHGTRQRVQASMAEVERVLQPGASMLMSFLSDRSDYIGSGSQLEEKTYRLQGGVDSGAPHHFQNQMELETLCSQAGLSLKMLQLEEYFTEDGHRSSHWYAVAEKPGP